MEKIKRIVLLFIFTCLLLAVGGCSARRQCKETADKYMDAVISRDYETIEDLSTGSKKVKIALSMYEDDRVVDAILSHCTYEIEDTTVSSKDKEGKVIYKVTLPDYRKALNDTPETFEEFNKNLSSDAYGTTSVKVTVKFTLKDGEWKVNNTEKLLTSFYGDLYDCSEELGYVFIDGNIKDAHFVRTIDGDFTYEAFCDYIEYDVTLVNPIKADITCSLIRDDKAITEQVISVDGDQFTFVCDKSGGSAFIPSGEYDLVIKDSHLRVIYKDKCEVSPINYNELLVEDSWSGADDNIYSSDTKEIILNYQLSRELYILGKVDMFYEGELLKSEDVFIEGANTLSLSADYFELNYMPVGTYIFKLYDEQEVLMYSFECEVILD